MDFLKNQILKHLSKFAKNTSTRNLNLSMIKGEGELRDLQLNEKVLTDLLELPSWMEITSAHVDYVSVKILWIKIRSCPIHLKLGDLRIMIRTLPNLRPTEASGDNGAPAATASKYGNVNKAIDGMTVDVNNVTIVLNRDLFTATLQICNLSLKSKNISWKDCSTDLRASRFKDPGGKNVLIFKELSWATTRIEITSKQKNSQAPVRLHTKQVICRLTIKKKIADCSVIGCRLALIMDKLDWTVTDSQLLVLVHFVDSIAELVKKSTEELQISKAARKLQSNEKFSEKVEKVLAKRSPEWDLFDRYDVVETSYHLVCSLILLRIFEDTDGRSVHEALQKGSSIEVRFFKIKIDHFPYHLAEGDRKHWIKYQEGSIYKWTRNSLAQFKARLVDCWPGRSASCHTPLGRASPHTLNASQGGSAKGADLSPGQLDALRQFSTLMATSTVLTCADLDVKFVRNLRGNLINKFILTVDKRGSAPGPTQPFLNVELMYFFYPGGYKFPVPSPKLYMQVSHLVAHLEAVSLIWLSAFANHLEHSFGAQSKAKPYIDIYIESQMAKAVIESIGEHLQPVCEGPCIKIQTSQVIVSNVRDTDPTIPGSTCSLFACLEDAQKGELFFITNFPSKDTDLQPIPQKFLLHATGSDSCKTPTEGQDLCESSLWTDARDIFFMNVGSVWTEFCQRPLQRGFRFVEPFPLYLWLYLDDTHPNNNLHLLVHTTTLINVQVDHQKFLFLTRLLDTMTEVGSFVTYDSNRIKGALQSVLVASVIVPQVDVSFVLPLDVDAPSVADSQDILSSKGGTHTFNSNESLQVQTPVHSTDNPMYKSQSEGCLLPENCPAPSSLARTFARSEHVSTLSIRSKPECVHRNIDDFADGVSLASNESDNFEIIEPVGTTAHTGDVMLVDTQYSMDIESGLDASEMVSESNHSQQDLQLQKQVSVVTFSLSKFKIIAESSGYNSVIKLDSNSIGCDEILQDSFQDFLVKFEERSRQWTPQSMVAKPCQFKARLETKGTARESFRVPQRLASPVSDVFAKCLSSESAEHNERYSTALPVDRMTRVEAEVSDLELSIHNSTSIRLSDLLQDQYLPLPLPMKVKLTNINIEMLEEKHSREGAKSFSYNIKLPQMTLLRDQHNDITLTQPDIENDGLLQKLQQAEEKLKKLELEKQELNNIIQGLSTDKSLA